MSNYNANQNKKTVGYKSCMKINGVPILPPLMTESRRKEMAYYKELAIAVESRLKLLKQTKSQDDSPYIKVDTSKTNFYKTEGPSYKLVFADPDIKTNEIKSDKESSSESDDNNLVTTVSCPNQICRDLDKTDSSPEIEVRNFSSAPMLVRSNSYTLEHPSPMLRAQLEQLGLYNSYKTNKVDKEEELKKDNMGACGDNIGQKIGVKRKLPMKYSELNNYNGYSEFHHQNDVYSDDELKPTKLDESFATNERKPRTIYQKNTDINYDKQDKQNDPEIPKIPTIENIESSQSFTVNFPASTQKSIQNLFETIQNNHTLQMQKLMEQQKADQELLRKAFEKQQALLLNEIHRSYSLSHVRTDLENPIINPDPEIPPQIENIYKLETKSSVDSGEGFIETSKVVLMESGELLKRASSSIDSYLDSHSSPSAKLSQDCLSNSSTTILCQKHIVEDSPNATLDITDVFYTPVDTPNKSGFDYKKTVDRFGDLIIEDVNEERSDLNQDDRSETNFSENDRDRLSVSNTSSVRGFQRELFPDNKFRDPEKEIRERAATVLCAAARSFLVRRLLKTQKVCSIKRAIRETLLCALKLHGEGGIRTSDADLHRRLIQQLNTACHELHDIFFKTTISERMRMISRDRDIIVGPYQHRRATSTMSNKSYSTSKYSVDCRQHFRHTSSKSLDKHDEPQFDYSPRKDVRRCMSYSLTRKPWR